MRPLPAHRRPWLAVLFVLGTTMAGCGPSGPGGSGSGPTASSSPGSASTGSPSATASAAQTAGASPGWTVVRATTLPTSLSTGLSRAVAIAAGTRIVVYGGFTSAGSTTDAILGFDPATGQLSTLGALAEPVHDAAGVALSGATLIFGGGNAAPVSTVQQIDSSAVARVVGHLPAARADLGAVTVGNSALIVGGGVPGSLDRQVLATEDGIHFRVLATLVVGVRYPAVVEAGGMIYLFGGVGSAGDTTDIQRIDPGTGTVDVIGQMPQPISHASAIVIGGTILVVGGRTVRKAQDAIWQVDVNTGTTHLVGHLPQPASDFAATAIGRTGYLIGGETGTQVVTIVSIDLQ